MVTAATTTISKRQVIRSCKARGWTLQPAVLDGILHEATPESLPELLDRIAVLMQQKQQQRTVTAELWQQLLIDQEENGGDDAVVMVQKKKASFVDIINAFDTPKLVFQTMRKQFQVQQKNWSLLGTAQDKINMLAERYAMLHQRVLRHELFRPNNLHHSSTGQHQLTPIESLLGNSSSKQQQHGGGTAPHLILVLGLLLQLQQEGVYYLEDPTGQVPVNLTNAVITDGSFVTEHCILLAEGHFQDGVLYVHRLGQPLQESRADAIAAIQQQVSHPFYYYHSGGAAKNNNRASLQVQTTTMMMTEEQSFVIFSDLPTDHPRVLQQLEAVWASYEAKSQHHEHDLPLFVLLGPFHSNPTRQQQGVDDLCALLARFPRLAAQAHVCLVPAVDRLGVLPYAADTTTITHHYVKKVPHCRTTSNPCRLRWAGRELVVLAHPDLLSTVQQHSMALPVVESSSSSSSSQEEPQQQPPNGYSRLIKTVLDQGHLLPVAGTPVWWNYNHALSLYPLPDCLVISSASSSSYTESYWGCRVIVAGSMAQQGTYAVYHPDQEQDDDESDSDTDEDMEASSSHAVEFCTLNEE